MKLIYTVCPEFYIPLATKFDGDLIVTESSSGRDTISDKKLIQMMQLIMSRNYDDIKIIENNVSREKNSQAFTALGYLAEYNKIPLQVITVKNDDAQSNNNKGKEPMAQ